MDHGAGAGLVTRADRDQLGARIRAERKRLSRTLKDVERESGLSSTHISEIERGKSSPTIGALVRIAHALGVDPAELLEAEPRRRVVVVRGDDRGVGRPATVRPLGSGVRGGHLRFAHVTLLDDEPVVFREVPELCAIVRTGDLIYELGERRERLGAGDAVHAVGVGAHTFRRGTTSDTRLTLVYVRT